MNRTRNFTLKAAVALAALAGTAAFMAPAAASVEREDISVDVAAPAMEREDISV